MVTQLNIIVFLIVRIKCQFCEQNEHQLTTKWCPIEEYKNNKISFVFETEFSLDDIIRIYYKERVIGECSKSPKECRTVSHHNLTTDINVLNKTNYVTLKIFNTSRHTFSDQLIATYGNPPKCKKSLCKPQFFSRARGMVCTSNISVEGVNVTCTAQIYPRGKCHAQVNALKNHSVTVHTEISNSNETHLGATSYFTIFCSTFLSRSNITQGTYNVTVSMYPNITSKETKTEFGTSYKITFTFGNPSVTLLDCPVELEEGETLNCMCVGTNNDSLPMTIYWYNATGNVVKGNKLLTPTSRMNSLEGFFCQAKNIFGWESEKMWYKLNTTQGSHNSLIVVCSAVGGCASGIMFLTAFCCLIRKKVCSRAPTANIIDIEINQNFTPTNVSNVSDMAYSAFDRSSRGGRNILSIHALYNELD